MNDSTTHATSASAPTPSFHAWVLDQANRNDAIGDLARDYRTGVRCRVHGRVRSPHGLVKILQKHNATQEALDTAARLRAEWEVRPSRSRNAMTDTATEHHDAPETDQFDGNPFSDPAHPLTVHVRLERWDGDYAIEIGSTSFDARPVFDAESLDTARNEYSDLDWVLYSANASGLVDEHEGPFTVEVPEDHAEYIAHRENVGMTGPDPAAVASLAAARLDHLRTKLERATAEVERLRAAIADAEKDGSAER